MLRCVPVYCPGDTGKAVRFLHLSQAFFCSQDVSEALFGGHDCRHFRGYEEVRTPAVKISRSAARGAPGTH